MLNKDRGERWKDVPHRPTSMARSQAKIARHGGERNFPPHRYTQLPTKHSVHAFEAMDTNVEREGLRDCRDRGGGGSLEEGADETFLPRSIRRPGMSGPMKRPSKTPRRWQHANAPCPSPYSILLVYISTRSVLYRTPFILYSAAPVLRRYPR